MIKFGKKVCTDIRIYMFLHFCSEFFPGKYYAKANENCTEFCSNVLVHVFDDPEILIINQKKIVH